MFKLYQRLSVSKLPASYFAGTYEYGEVPTGQRAAPPPAPVGHPQSTRSVMQLFTRKEIEQRSRRNDAAIIIDNVVYDVTKFLEDHPGGVEVLLNNAGKDASRCFHDVGHSDDAKNWRSTFKIGEVVVEDRWEVIKDEPNIVDSHHKLTLRGLIDLWTPPLAFAAIAILMYIYIL